MSAEDAIMETGRVNRNIGALSVTESITARVAAMSGRLHAWQSLRTLDLQHRAICRLGARKATLGCLRS